MNPQRRWQLVAGLLIAALAIYGLSFPQIHGWEVGLVVLGGLLFASGVSIPMPYWWAAIPGIIFLVRGFESSRVNAKIGPLLVAGVFLILVAAKSPRKHTQEPKARRA